FKLLAPFEPDELVENNNSLVVKMSYGETSVIITGDAQTEEEQRMLSEGMDVSAQVLLAGHHGSSNSSSETFLQAVRPEYTVIS
ncbi:MAG: MBL fold metallo-hydrolase, partial [Lachnospiraceae bacterium]|nr:MBL fold metallo-hydrolase [Lachnospiraceae bacterium]